MGDARRHGGRTNSLRGVHKKSACYPSRDGQAGDGAGASPLSAGWQVTRSRSELPEIKDLREIPDFADEAEEAEFWATHQFSDSLAARGVMPPHGLLPKPRPRTVPVAVRFDSSTLDRIKAVALRRHKGYQTLLKEFVVERLYEEERREGLISLHRETTHRPE